MLNINFNILTKYKNTKLNFIVHNNMYSFWNTNISFECMSNELRMSSKL